MHKTKFAIVTAVWKRPEIFEMFAAAIKKLHHDELEIIVIVAGSEGQKTRRMVNKHGFLYIETPNFPLSNKMNQTTLSAVKSGAKYVLCVGSDDLITQELLNRYVLSIKKNVDFAAVTDFYFYDTKTDVFAYWSGYKDKKRIGHTCGAGRMLSRALLMKMNCKPWSENINKGLDSSMSKRLNTIIHKSDVFSLKSENLFAFDVKSDMNITKFELWPNTEIINDDKTIRQTFNLISK